MKGDAMIRNCSSLHPLYFFNNLGVIMISMKKYSLAGLYFSKSLKYLDVTPRQIHHKSLRKLLTNHSSQRRSEVLFNYGLSLMHSNQSKAFRCFDAASGVMGSNPQLWFFMGVCCVRNYQGLV